MIYRILSKPHILLFDLSIGSIKKYRTKYFTALRSTVRKILPDNSHNREKLEAKNGKIITRSIKRRC